jgi:hypothetical protein
MGRVKWTQTGKELQFSGKLCVREELVLVAGGNGHEGEGKMIGRKREGAGRKDRYENM